VFRLDTSDCTITSVRLRSSNFDWEDMAIVFPNGEPAVAVADIGDNYAFRSNIRLVVAREADLLSAANEIDAIELTARYPDGAHNAECLLSDPASGAIGIVTKSFTGGARAYGVPSIDAFDGAVLTDLGPVVLPSETEGSTDARELAITGCSVAPDGAALVIRTPDRAWEFSLANGDFAAALAGTPTEIVVPETIQGESVTWSIDGTELWWTTEGAEAPVFRSTGGTPRVAVVPTTTSTSAPGTASTSVPPSRSPSGDNTEPPIAALALVAAFLAVCLVIVVRIRAARR
jgi:hypothetical protein